MNEIIFNYKDLEYKIKCNPNETFMDICNKFGEKIKIPIYYIDFYYNGNKLNKKLTIKELPILKSENSKNNNIM